MYLQSTQRRNWLLLPIFCLAVVVRVNAFSVVNPSPLITTKEQTTFVASGEQQGGGFGIVSGAFSMQEKNVASVVEQDEHDIARVPLFEIKRRLLDLLRSMTGKDEEFRLVEMYVNALEEAYIPPLTLDFFNLAMTGDWQLLFSTNLSSSSSGGPKPNFRLRELLQRIDSNRFEGNLTNVATFDFCEENDGSSTTFDGTGTFSVKCTYQIHQGARMECKLTDMLLEPAQGSKILQSNVPSLVGMLHQSMPKEMFDPNQHAMDTTYLDGDLKIVRLSGHKFERVRNVFLRKRHHSKS